LDAEAERIFSQAAARLVRGHDGLLSSGSIGIYDLEVREENSRGKGRQPGAQRKTCCLLMANSFYCTFKPLYSAGSQECCTYCACTEPEALPNSRRGQGRRLAPLLVCLVNYFFPFSITPATRLWAIPARNQPKQGGTRSLFPLEKG